MPFEVNPSYKGRSKHHHEGDRITYLPVEFRHKSEIHAVQAGDKGWRHDDHGNQGKDLNDLVLVDIDKPEKSILQVFQPFKKKIGVINQ